MSARAPKMYTLGTYYNIIDTHIKLQDAKCLDCVIRHMVVKKS